MESFAQGQLFTGCPVIITILLSFPVGLFYMAGSMLIYWVIIELFIWRIKKALGKKEHNLQDANQKGAECPL